MNKHFNREDERLATVVQLANATPDLRAELIEEYRVAPALGAFTMHSILDATCLRLWLLADGLRLRCQRVTVGGFLPLNLLLQKCQKSSQATRALERVEFLTGCEIAFNIARFAWSLPVWTSPGYESLCLRWPGLP